MMTEPRPGQRVSSRRLFDGEDLVVFSVSGHGENARVTVEFPITDRDGRVLDTNTTILRASELELVEGPGTWSRPPW